MRLYEILERFKRLDSAFVGECRAQDFEAHGLLPLNLATQSYISYIHKDKYLAMLDSSKAGAVFVHKKMSDKISHKNAVFVEPGSCRSPASADDRPLLSLRQQYPLPHCLRS